MLVSSKPRKASSKKRPTSYKATKLHQQSIQPKMKTISGYSDRPLLSNKKKPAKGKVAKKRPQTAQVRTQGRVPQHQLNYNPYPQLTQEQAMQLLQQQ
jgi:hypothetical protein